MSTAWGVVVVLLSVLAWGGQVVSWLAPETAIRWSVMEAEEDVEPAFWADVRGEAWWDAFTLWIMVLAGTLLILDVRAWAYAGLVGGGMYLYFGGRGILTRLAMTRRGLRIGAPANVRLGFVFSGVWAMMAAVTIVAAIVTLEG